MPPEWQDPPPPALVDRTSQITSRYGEAIPGFHQFTFVDLVDERREVTQALLEMDCLPAGMELFPAANDDQWTLIRGVIAQSDYYLVILGGRYGSMTNEGISYTEKEYDYAVEIGVPVMGFVIADADELPVKRTDRNDAAAKKLEEFRTKVQRRMTKDWKNAEDLGSKVTRGLIHLVKNNPRPGWVRGDLAMTSETRVKIAELEAKIAILEKQELQTQAPGTTEINAAYAHGKETAEISLRHSGRESYSSASEDGELTYSWDEIFGVLGPFMLDEAPDPVLRQTFNNHMLSDIHNDPNHYWSSGWTHEKAEVSDKSWGAILVQLRALGMIASGTKNRTASDKAVYWKLTDAGDAYLVGLRAMPSLAK